MKCSRHDDDQHRHELECRYWWKVTKGDRHAIRDVLERIEAKRGKRGMERVRAGLMAMWRSENANGKN